MHQMSDFKAKMHQIVCWLGLRPRLRWGAYSAPPYPLAGFRGPTSKGRGRDEGRKWVEKDRKGEMGGAGLPPLLKLGPRTIFLAPALWKSHIGLPISVN